MKNSISWYQDIQTNYFVLILISKNISKYQKIFLDINKYFLISKRNRLLDIKNSIYWYQEFHFLISRNKFHFLITRIIFFYIKKWILDIKKYLINSQTAPQNTFLDINIKRFLDIKKRFLDIKKSFLDIKNSIFLYKERCTISWYQKIEFLLSRNAFLISRIRSRYIYCFVFILISKNISWYQKIFLDIKKYFLISKKYFLISRNQEMLNK